MGKNKYLGLTITMSLLTVAAMVAAVFVVMQYVFTEPLNVNLNIDLASAPKEEATITENANMSNRAYACEAEGVLYYSDANKGIYYTTEDTKDQLLAEGCFSDMCTLGSKLVCAESYQRDDETELLQLVMFDRTSGEKEVVFDTSETEEEIASLAILHKIGSKIYFSVNGKDLYTVNARGKVKETKIDNPKKVTSSGVYVDNGDGYGLRLVSLKNKELQVFDLYNAEEDYTYKADVLLEAEGQLYLRLMNDEETVDYVKLDMSTGEYASLPYKKAYGTLTNMNYYDGQIYMTFFKWKTCYVCRIDAASDSSKVKLIKSMKAPSEEFNPISIADDTIFVTYPYSNNKPVKIAIKK